jgi:5-oxoprolinase (ATP-hydrolysing) subunit A
MISIDLNCDMGEGMENDAFIMPFISSANIACGYHAGDNDIMKRTIGLSVKHGVAIGAHPGFADKENFGRTEQHLSNEAYYDLVSKQLAIIQKFIDEAGATLHHVKPHGALYNMSAKDPILANIIAAAVKDHNPSLKLYGLSNSYSITEAEKTGLQAVSEVFADRTYTDEGNLTPRNQPNALISSEQQSLQQVLQMIRQQRVTSTGNKTVPVKAGTICIHGDGAHAVSFAHLIFTTLKENNIVIKPV